MQSDELGYGERFASSFGADGILSLLWKQLSEFVLTGSISAVMKSKTDQFSRQGRRNR
jgi:hypothetical protein